MTSLTWNCTLPCCIILLVTRYWFLSDDMSVNLSEKSVQFQLVYGLPDRPICLPAIFICGGNLRGKVYSKNPYTIEDLKTNIRNAIVEITQNELAKVAGNMLKRAELCIQVHGEQFQHLLSLLNVLHVVLNNNNVPYCTVLHSVFTWVTR